MDSPVFLSLVVINYHTPELTVACLQSIFRYAPSRPYEVILIDNSSRGSFETDIAELFPAVRFIRNSDNKGFANGNNLGISNAHGKYFVLLNSDACLTEPVLDAMLEYMEENPDIGAVGPRQVDGENKFQLSFGKFPNLVSELVRKILHYRLSINDHVVRDYLDATHSEIKQVDWVSGSCMLLRRAALEAAGLFDEQFFMYFEDIDLCRRIELHGWKIRYFPHVTLTHYGGCSSQFNLMRVYVAYRQSQLYFSRKYYGFFGALLVRGLLLFKYGLNAVQWLPVFMFQLLMRGNKKKSYTMLLLSKKVLQLVCSRIEKHPKVVPLEPSFAQAAVPLAFSAKVRR